MRTRLVPLLLAATALLAMAPVAASAADPSVLTNNKAGGPKVRVGATLKAHLKGKAVLIIPGTSAGVRCSRASVTDTVRHNPAAPGIAVESLTAQTFSTCSSSIPGTTGVKKISVLNLPYRTTISSETGHPVTIYKASTRLTLNTVVGALTCTYRAARLKGAAVNTDQEISFTGQRFTLSSGSAACPGQGDFSATFGPVTNVTNSKHPHVYVN